MKIKIKNKNYTVKNTVRALFLFEKITGKHFSVDTLLDNYIYFYSLLLANNPEMTLTWDQFIDALDSDPKIMENLNRMLLEAQGVEEVYTKADDKEDDTGKKD